MENGTQKTFAGNVVRIAQQIDANQKQRETLFAELAELVATEGNGSAKSLHDRIARKARPAKAKATPKPKVVAKTKPARRKRKGTPRTDRIVAYLAKRKGKTFSPTEISKGIGEPKAAAVVNATLLSLVKQGYVAKKGKGAYTAGRKAGK